MMRLLRRLLWLGLLAGGGYGAYRVWSGRQAKSAAGPEWPSLPSQSSQPRVTEVPATHTRAADPAQRWVLPIDGDCPPGYPLKANDNSGIYHSPGGRFYDRTVAERCYANAHDAIADGYRAAKA
jgi:hypothetical protein